MAVGARSSSGTARAQHSTGETVACPIGDCCDVLVLSKHTCTRAHTVAHTAVP